MEHLGPIMQLRGVVKVFANGTLALRGVDLDIERGKVHGLLVIAHPHLALGATD